jgi:archaellum component FlaC
MIHRARVFNERTNERKIMKTIAEIQSELDAVSKRQSELWSKYQEAGRALEPLKSEWLESYNRQQKLEQQVKWLKEMGVA